jgi:hypothetical protein
MPNKEDFGGFRKGFLLEKKDTGEVAETLERHRLSTGDQQRVIMGIEPKEQHKQRPTDQEGKSQPSSDFGSLQRGFLLRDSRSSQRRQASADQTQSQGIAAQPDSQGKGERSDQDKGLSRTGESSIQPERLSEFQLETLYKQFERLSGARLKQQRSLMPEYVLIQLSDYHVKRIIQECLERGIVSPGSATTYTERIDMMTQKKMRGEKLTSGDDQFTREKILPILTKLESHKASEKLTDEMEDMEGFTEEGDVLRVVKNIKGEADSSIQLLKYMAHPPSSQR